MITEIATPKPDFQPVSIKLTFNTQKELDVFGSMCNCAPLRTAICALGGVLPDYEVLKDAGADIKNSSYVLDELSKIRISRL